jgi:hypothetical protein
MYLFTLLFACQTEKNTEDTGQNPTDTAVIDTAEGTDTGTETGSPETGEPTESEFSGASMSYNDCSPVDGWALRFQFGVSSESCEDTLTDDHILLYFYQPDFQSGTEQTISGTGMSTGSAVLLRDQGNDLQLVTEGSVIIEWNGAENSSADWVEGLEYSGSFDLSFEDGSQHSAQFNGVFCAGEVFCG